MTYTQTLSGNDQSLAKQTLALAAVFQAGWVVQQLAEKNTWLSEDAEPLIKSVVQLEPKSFEDIYPFPAALKPGINILSQTYIRKNISEIQNAVRYSLLLLQVEKLLERQPEMLATIRRGIEHFNTHFDIQNVWNDTVTYERLAHLYTETASKLRLRVLVSGNPEVMKSELNVARTRSSLLAGIRAAMLWRQLGGRRWHVVFNRKRILKGLEIVSKLHPRLY